MFGATQQALACNLAGEPSWPYHVLSQSPRVYLHPAEVRGTTCTFSCNAYCDCNGRSQRNSASLSARVRSILHGLKSSESVQSCLIPDLKRASLSDSVRHRGPDGDGRGGGLPSRLQRCQLEYGARVYLSSAAGSWRPGD